MTYTYTIITPNTTTRFSSELPYLEAPLYFAYQLAEQKGFKLKHCQVTYNGHIITKENTNFNYYKKNYKKIMNDQTKTYPLLTHVSSLPSEKENKKV